MNKNGKTHKPQTYPPENNHGQEIKTGIDRNDKLTQEVEQSYKFKKNYSCWWYFWRGLKGKTFWNWLELLIAPALISLGAAAVTLLWSYFDYNAASELEATRYHQRLVKEYIDSIKVLLLDEYHHEEYKKPEILPQDVENFVKSKTATTIKALENSPKQRERLINFLRRVEVGFAPLNGDFQVIPQDICDLPVTTTKNKEYSHFLCGINLDEANLEKNKLHYSVFQDAKFHKAKLIEANLDNSHLQNAFLIKAELQKASLKKADLTNAILKQADLRGAKLIGADLTNAILEQADLSCYDENLLCNEKIKNPNLTEDEMEEIQADLKGADLTGAKLIGADLTGANLTGAKLIGADLTNAIVSKTKFENALFDSSTELPFDQKKAKEYKMLEIARDADLEGADLTGADLTGADLTGANLTGAKLIGADLTGTILTNAKIDEKTKFKNALFDSSTELPFDQEKAKKEYKMLKIAPGADLKGADLEAADLEAANLTKANLREAKLNGIRLDSQTKFENALFDSSTELPFDQEKAKKEYRMLKIAPSADLRGADLTDADLKGADLTKADLRGAKLNNAKIDEKTKFENALFDSSTELPFDQEKAKEYKMLEIAPDADLEGADLTDTNLAVANLKGANLTNADLKGANLTDANLTDTNLTNANLTDADLTDANLTNATITDTQLALAKLCRTIKHKDNDDEKILSKYCNFYSISSTSNFPLRQSMESR